MVGLLASKEAEVGLELVMEAKYSLKVAAVADADLIPKVVEVHLVLGLVTMLVAELVVEPVAVVAEPMVAVAEFLAEPVEPREVALRVFAGVVVPMVVEAESLSVMTGPMEAGPVAAAAALAHAVDPKSVAFVAAGVAAHESVPRVAEPVAEAVVAPQTAPKAAEHVSVCALALGVDSRIAEFGGSKY